MKFRSHGHYATEQTVTIVANTPITQEFDPESLTLRVLEIGCGFLEWVKHLPSAAEKGSNSETPTSNSKSEEASCDYSSIKTTGVVVVGSLQNQRWYVQFATGCLASMSSN